MTMLVNIPIPRKRNPMYRQDWLTLENEGILTQRLMFHVMHDNQGFAMEHVSTLSLLFQALGFVCRLMVGPTIVSSVPSTSFVTEQLSRMTISLDQSQEDSQTLNRVTDDSDSLYLVPCHLPDFHTDIQKLCDVWKEGFLFNFCDFLPPWLFQHLIVQLVSHMQRQRDLISHLKFRRLPLLSKKACLMAQNSRVHFIIELWRTRIFIRYQDQLRLF